MHFRRYLSVSIIVGQHLAQRLEKRLQFYHRYITIHV